MNAVVVCSILDVFRIIPETFRYAVWAAVLGIVVAAVVPVVILGFVQRRSQGPGPDGGSLLICGVLFVLLSLQFIPMFAAFSFKRQIGKAESQVCESISELALSEAVSGTGLADSFREADASEMIRRNSERMHGYLNGVIVKTLLVSIAAIALATIWLIRITPCGRPPSRRRTPPPPRRMTRPRNRRY